MNQEKPGGANALAKIKSLVILGMANHSKITLAHILGNSFVFTSENFRNPKLPHGLKVVQVPLVEGRIFSDNFITLHTRHTRMSKSVKHYLSFLENL